MKKLVFVILFVLLVSSLWSVDKNVRFNVLFSSNYIPYGEGIFSSFSDNHTGEGEWFTPQLMIFEYLINGELSLAIGNEIAFNDSFALFSDFDLYGMFVRGVYGAGIRAGIQLFFLEFFVGYEGYFDSHYMGNVLFYKMFNMDNVVWKPGFGHGPRAGVRAYVDDNSFWEGMYSYGLNGSPSFLKISYGFNTSFNKDDVPEEKTDYEASEVKNI